MRDRGERRTSPAPPHIWKHVGRYGAGRCFRTAASAQNLLKTLSPQRRRKPGQSQDLELKHKGLDGVQGPTRSPGLGWGEDLGPDCKRIVGFFSVYSERTCQRRGRTCCCMSRVDVLVPSWEGCWTYPQHPVLSSSISEPPAGPSPPVSGLMFSIWTGSDRRSRARLTACGSSP